ncbi:hypothetical protein Naga_100724g1 [Nannochloropsis gaditana]|uniref:Uncharacterized protein n=1 Tax=Nannochloropsis gaditana TaxID=72520 RepID=W7T5F1_9STRA|nr:hypothetical protein Naga_100724g1 [Nannochloropsis gaditana]
MPPVFTVRKGPADLVRKGARSTAEAVALALRWLGGEDVAQAVLRGVQAANVMQLSLMDPATVRHRREREGYVENLYTQGLPAFPSRPPSRPLSRPPSGPFALHS